MSTDPIVAQLSKKCEDLVKTLNLGRIRATYRPASSDQNMPTVRIDIPVDRNKTGLVINEFLGAILDADPKLLTLYSGDNGSYISYRIKPEGNEKYKSHRAMVDALKEEVITAIKKFSDGTPKEKEKIISNAVTHFNWFANNNGFKESQGVTKIKEWVEEFGIGPGFGASAKKPVNQK